MKFRAIVQLNGKTATGIQVPEEVVESLNAGKKPKVKVTINGYTYRSTVGTMKGKFMIPVSAEHRKGADIVAGEEVDVDIVLDAELRTVTIPPDFAEALDREPAAKTFFEGLSYSNKQRFVLPIEGAKKEETRKRRINKSVILLKEGKIQ
ncbi:YdeI/OmpD-associated family protein [Camelliibacillus cellulosilyticus]|uniref:YdeI/OmpD-associated family protein n=1 Tax=Camelliibacillus cellulosilyticus TaxID=2174486 RepID=A0ABV9GH71_9BACL